MNTLIRFRVKGLGVWVVPHPNSGESNGKEHPNSGESNGKEHGKLNGNWDNVGVHGSNLK